MKRAIELALTYPHTHPNPRVGAVIVDSESGDVIGEGWHRGPGTDHAEIVALRQAGDAARDAIVYVTLEPCSHHGRTPPCVEALVDAAVAKVVVGALDPDERVSGTGVERLRQANIAVVAGFEEGESRSVDPAYFHHRETGMPMVTLKWGMTLDGSVAARDGSSKWITDTQARADAHELRSRVDAVLVGAGTLRDDDPRLDVRIDGYDRAQPRPVVISGRGELPADARLWERDPVVVSGRQREIPAGVLVEVAGEGGVPDPTQACLALANKGLLHLMIEGGPTLAGAWWRAGVVTDGVVYVGAKIGGGTGLAPLAGDFATITGAADVEFGPVRGVGDDVVIPFRRKG